MDIALPQGNEKEILEMATLLGTGEILFLYGSGKKAYNPAVEGISIRRGMISKSGETTFVREEDLDQNLSREFLALIPDDRYPYKKLQNIKLNRIMGNPALCIPFSMFLRSQHSATVWQATKRMLRLWRGARRPFLLGSFAGNPYELRNISDLESFYRVLGLRTDEVKQGFAFLNDNLR